MISPRVHPKGPFATPPLATQERSIRVAPPPHPVHVTHSTLDAVHNAYTDRGTRGGERSFCCVTRAACCTTGASLTGRGLYSQRHQPPPTLASGRLKEPERSPAQLRRTSVFSLPPSDPGWMYSNTDSPTDVSGERGQRAPTHESTNLRPHWGSWRGSF